MPIDLNIVSEYWTRIISELGPGGLELTTWSVYRPKGIHFTARASGDAIVVEGPSISSSRIISYREFECVAKLYNAYIGGVAGIRPTIRDRCGWNSSYVITLIHEFCEG